MEENFPMLPEGSRAPEYGFVYRGGFKDKNPEIRAVNQIYTFVEFLICVVRCLSKPQKGGHIDVRAR